jgi:hypothetical protein
MTEVDTHSSSKLHESEQDIEQVQNEQQEEKQLDEQDDQRRNQPCKYWSSGKCKFGEHCRFSHDFPMTLYGQIPMMGGYYAPYTNAPSLEYGDEAAASYARSTMITPCKFFYKGKCKYGYNCRFSHLHPFAYPYGPHTPMFPYPYAAYGGFPLYQPNGLMRRPRSIEQEYQDQHEQHSENKDQDETSDEDYDQVIENLKHNMHQSLSNFQQQFYQYRDNQNASHTSANIKSLNQIAKSLQDLSLAFATALENQVTTPSNRNIISYLKNLIPTLTEDDISQIENICNREKDKFNGNYNDNHSHSDSETTKKNKTNNLNPRLPQSSKKETPKKSLPSQGSVSTVNANIDTTLPQYAPNSYAAVLCKPKPENHTQQVSIAKSVPL